MGGARVHPAALPVALAGALLAAGCGDWFRRHDPAIPGALGAVDAGARLGNRALDRFAPPDFSAVPREIFGTLRVVVHWPRSAQVIPDSTEALLVRLLKTDGSHAANPVAVTRPSGQATQSIGITLPEQDDLTLAVTAYRNVPADLTGFTGAAPAEAVASGTKGGVAIRRGVDLTLKIKLGSLFAPSLGSPTSKVGIPGDLVTFVLGRNLATGSLQVRFNGADATEINRLSDTSVQARIPPGATSGYVGVTVDGVPADNDPYLFVAGDFALDLGAKAIGGISVPGGYVYYGDTLPVRALYTWTTGAATPDDEFEPMPLWRLDHLESPARNDLATASANPGAASVKAAGALAASKVTVSLGAYHTLAATVSAVGVDRVALSPTTAELNAPPSAGDASQRYPEASRSISLGGSVVHTLPPGLPFDLGIDWSSDTASVSVDGNGLVRVLPGAGKGVATVTATSRLDPSRSANASIAVSVFGDLNVRVR